MSKRKFLFLVAFVLLFFLFGKNDDSSSCESFSAIRAPNDSNSDVVVMISHECSNKQDNILSSLCMEFGTFVVFEWSPKKFSEVNVDSDDRNNDSNDRE